MKTRELMVKQGNWLFRYRSYLPIILIVLALLSMWFSRNIYKAEQVWFDILCLLIAVSGEVIRVISVGYAADRTSGRNTKQQVADEINRTGIYSIVRNPLYIGNFFMWLGVALFTRIWWLVIIYILIYLYYYERIILAEEDFLDGKFGAVFEDYTEKVNSIVPCMKNYQPNKYRFRIKKVLRQENSSIFGIILVFFIVELFQDFISGGKIQPEIYWIILMGMFTAYYLVIRILKKQTRLLHNDAQQENSSS